MKKCAYASIMIMVAIMMLPSVSVYASTLSSDELTEKYHEAFLRATSDRNPDFTDDDSTAYYDENGCLSRIVFSPYCTLDVASQTFIYSGSEYQDFYYVLNADESVTIIGTDTSAIRLRDTASLEIPAQIDGHSVNEIGTAAFYGIGQTTPTLTEIIIPATVKKINCYAFYQAFAGRSGCSVNIPESIQYLGHMSFGALDDALGETVILPETLEYADYFAFGDRTMIQELILPKSTVVCMTGCMLFGQDQRACFDSCIMHPVVEAFLENSESTTDAVAKWKTSLPQTDSEEAFHLNRKSSISILTEPGDVNTNGSVDIADAVLLARFLAEDAEINVSAAGKANADLDADGNLTGADQTLLLELIANVNA